MKKVVFLCSARANSKPENDHLNETLADKIEKLDFGCIYAARDTDQTQPANIVHATNKSHIKNSEIFVAVLKNYSKNLAGEVGYAHARKELGQNPRVILGLDFGETNPDDLMMIQSFDKIIKPEELEAELKKYA